MYLLVSKPKYTLAATSSEQKQASVLAQTADPHWMCLLVRSRLHLAANSMYLSLRASDTVNALWVLSPGLDAAVLARYDY